MKRRSRGVTLVEILIAISLMAILGLVLARSLEAGTNLERRMNQNWSRVSAEREFERRLRQSIGSARLSATTGATSSFFYAGAVALGGNGITSDSVTWTGDASPPAVLVEASGTFEELNERIGPQGGLAEYSLSTTPIGQAGGRTGLFLRVQVPADGDPTQGGFEQLLNENIDSLSFEFFDGLVWVGAWDTSLSNPPRIPAAVRMTYRLTGDAREHQLVIRLKHSDVTPENPVAIGGAP